MAIKPICDFCTQELKDFGGILLSPPDSRSHVKKMHICRACYAAITLALPKTSGRKGRSRVNF